MKLYIANCSRQKHRFNYKLPERAQQFGVTINPGQQHMIENQSEVIHHIISQHQPYGFLPAKKLDPHFSGICYSTDKPVTVGAIEEGAEQKTENLENLSQEILEASAATINATVENEVIKTGEQPASDGIQLEVKGEPVNAEHADAKAVQKTINVSKK